MFETTNAADRNGWFFLMRRVAESLSALGDRRRAGGGTKAGRRDPARSGGAGLALGRPAGYQIGRRLSIRNAALAWIGRECAEAAHTQVLVGCTGWEDDLERAEAGVAGVPVIDVAALHQDVAAWLAHGAVKGYSGTPAARYATSHGMDVSVDFAPSSGACVHREVKAINDLHVFPVARTRATVMVPTLRSGGPRRDVNGAELITYWRGNRIAAAGPAVFGDREESIQPAVHRVAGIGSLPSYGQVCGLFAVDVAGSTAPERDDEIQLHVHKSLYEIMQTAFDGSGVPWKRCIHEDRGDGALVVVPPDLAAAPLVDPLPERLRALIRRYNRVVREPARIRLRAAAHIGPVHHDGNGFVGSDINLLFRMLEARQFKRMLAESGTELALIASCYVYENIIVRHPSLADPAEFQPLNVRVSGTRVRAWVYVPGKTRA